MALKVQWYLLLRVLSRKRRMVPYELARSDDSSGRESWAPNLVLIEVAPLQAVEAPVFRILDSICFVKCTHN